MALMKPATPSSGWISPPGATSPTARRSTFGPLVQAGPYGVRRDDHRIDMDEVRELAREHKPKMIIAGGSAYPRIIDFRAFREIADEVGAKLMVDMAHSPASSPAACIRRRSPMRTSSPRPRTRRCAARAGASSSQRRGLAKKINSAVFPGLQGGPLMHVIAAKAVAFGEALRPTFKVYAKNVVENAKALAETLKSSGFASSPAAPTRT